MAKPLQFIKLIQSSLEEDCWQQDWTSQWVVPKSLPGKASILAKQNGVWCGTQILDAFTLVMGRQLRVQKKIQDGQFFDQGQSLAILDGNLQTLLKIERTLLNFIQHSCGICTLTHQLVKEAYPIQILATRKTLPGLKALQYYAVETGGAVPHRHDLAESILIKDNHWAQLKPMWNQLYQKAQKLEKKIIIEVSSLEQLEYCLRLPIHRILLDNFPIAELEQAVRMRKKLNKIMPYEVSGNIQSVHLKKLKKLGIEFVSVGMITHSPKACDLSLEID